MENRLTPQFAAKVERLMGRDERSLADRADLAAEIERLRAQLKAEHETAVAAIAGSEKEIERLRSQIDTCQGNAHYRAWQESQAENERLRAALEHMLTIGHVDASWYQAIARHALARDT